MSKYGNRRVVYNGIVFDSKAEKERYIELLLLERAGKIENLQRQAVFLLIPKQPDEKSVKYTADFIYIENGSKIAEDVKSEVTAKDKVYVLKRKLFKLKHTDWTFKEVIM
jgi:hypothetical protein